mmetsp:Transcript_30522/g.72574  ORF Transcript_30522/g.72574 Transcript_30522/m.72574 type:complete len:225 (-) Transcript_30522:1183-1857(-)
MFSFTTATKTVASAVSNVRPAMIVCPATVAWIFGRPDETSASIDSSVFGCTTPRVPRHTKFLRTDLVSLSYVPIAPSAMLARQKNDTIKFSPLILVHIAGSWSCAANSRTPGAFGLTHVFAMSPSGWITCRVRTERYARRPTLRHKSMSCPAAQSMRHLQTEGRSPGSHGMHAWWHLSMCSWSVYVMPSLVHVLAPSMHSWHISLTPTASVLASVTSPASIAFR